MFAQHIKDMCNHPHLPFNCHLEIQLYKMNEYYTITCAELIAQSVCTILQQLIPLESFSAMPTGAIVTGRIADETTLTQWQVCLLCLVFFSLQYSIFTESMLMHYTIISQKSTHPQRSAQPLFWPNFLYSVKVYSNECPPRLSFA